MTLLRSYSKLLAIVRQWWSSRIRISTLTTTPIQGNTLQNVKINGRYVKYFGTVSSHLFPNDMNHKEETRLFEEPRKLANSTGAWNRSFYPIFNKGLYHLETLLIIYRPKKGLSAGSLCGPLESSPLSTCSKRTFVLPPKVSYFRFKYIIITT